MFLNWPTQVMAIITSIILIIIAFICGDGRAVYDGGGSNLSKIQKDVKNDYSNLKLPKHKISFDEFCYPKKFTLQNPQKFIGEYMSPGTRHMNLLGFHRIGAGKTCAAITAAEKWMGNISEKSKPMIVMPASLIPGFRNELRGPCPEASGFSYITHDEREELRALSPSDPRYREIVKKSDALIDSRYTIFSYNKFAKEAKGLDPPILIIDEVHNINNPSGTYYNAFMKFIRERPKMRLIVLSATPIFDHASEIISLLQLMRQDVTMDKLNDLPKLQQTLDGLVSYYEGAPPHTFPKTTLHHEVCRMSDFQTRWFRAEVEAEIKKSGDINLREITNNFYMKSRAKSNMVFPHGLSGTDGLPQLSNDRIRESLDSYSCKFAKLLKKLAKGQLSFVYTNFTSFGGIKSMRKILKAFGYLEYNKHGAGPKRFAVWTGEQTPREKDAIRSVFNSPGNDDGKMLQIIIGSPAMKEGVSLLRVRQVHVMEPYWNHSRLEQIYGRAVRFCSHKVLPSSERHVDIYLYIAVVASSKCTKYNFDRHRDMPPEESVDMYILGLADQKRELTSELISLLVDTAADRALGFGGD